MLCQREQICDVNSLKASKGISRIPRISVLSSYATDFLNLNLSM